MAQNLLLSTHSIAVIPATQVLTETCKFVQKEGMERGIGTFSEWEFRQYGIFHSYKLIDEIQICSLEYEETDLLRKETTGFFQGNLLNKFDSDFVN